MFTKSFGNYIPIALTVIFSLILTSVCQATPVLSLTYSPTAPTTPVTYTGTCTNWGGANCPAGNWASTLLASETGTCTVTGTGSVTFGAVLLNALIATVSGTFSTSTSFTSTEAVSYSSGVTIAVPVCTIYMATISSTTQSNGGTYVGVWHKAAGSIKSYGPQTGATSFGPAGTPASCTDCGG